MHTIRRCRTTSEHPPERDVCAVTSLPGGVLAESRVAFSRLHLLSLVNKDTVRYIRPS